MSNHAMWHKRESRRSEPCVCAGRPKPTKSGQEEGLRAVGQMKLRRDAASYHPGSHKQHVGGLCYIFLSKDLGLVIRPVEVTGELDACAVCAEVRVRVSVRPSGVDVVNLGKPSRPEGILTLVCACRDCTV